MIEQHRVQPSEDLGSFRLEKVEWQLNNHLLGKAKHLLRALCEAVLAILSVVGVAKTVAWEPIIRLPQQSWKTS